MRIKAYAVCGTTRKGDIYIARSIHAGAYAIFEKKKDAQHYLKTYMGSHIKPITLEVGE